MVKHKDYDAARRERAAQTGEDETSGDRRLKPFTFTLRGDEYKVVGPVPGAVLMELAASEGQAGGAGVRALYAFLDAALDEESVHRFVAALKRRENPIELPDVLEIVRDIVAEMNGRPTTRPSGSPDGSSSTGQSSMVGAWPGM